MKFLSILLLLLVCYPADALAGGEPNPAVERIRVWLLGGQSNAAGRGDPSELPTSPDDLQAAQEDVDFYNGSNGPLIALQPGAQFGPEITLGRRLANYLPAEPEARMAILKYGRGGTDLNNQWKAGGDATSSGDGGDYVTFQTTVANGLAALTTCYPNAGVEIAGMVWVQGERDARQGYHETYEANLTAFIADIRLTFGADLPFVVVRLSSGQTDLPLANLNVIRAAQSAVAAADPRTALINTDAFSLKSDALHFDALGQQQIGTASAMLLASFLPMPPASIVAGEACIVQISGALIGFRYTLESSTSLAPDGWETVETRIASGPVLAFEYHLPEGAVRRFLRIARSP